MKANKAPEKIYVHKSLYWGLMANEHNITEDDIEYVRKDAFIEKAYTYLNEKCRRFILTAKDIDDFIKYMKGE